MKLKDFLKECHEKRVIKMLSIYAVSSWGFLKVFAILWEPLGIPEIVITYFIILLVLGFPLYLYYIWRSRLASGERNRVGVDEHGKRKRSTFKKVYFIITGIIAILCTVASAIIYQNKSGDLSFVTTSVDESDKIAVLQFGNNTGDPKYDIVGKMASDWIIHGINEDQVAQVISPEIISDYSSLLNAEERESGSNDILKTYFKPKEIISGNYYLEGDQLIFQCSITKGDINETLIAFKPTKCGESEPLDCIEELKQLITGYFVTEEKPELQLQNLPPKFEAYQDLLNAKANFSDNEMYISLLKSASEKDPDYFEPKVLQVAYYYNIGEFKRADSLRETIHPNSLNNKRQTNLLKHYEALLTGKNDKIYSTGKKEYDIAPFDLFSNASTMVVALQFVNRPQDVEAIYNEISMENMDIENSAICQDRIYVKALADIELKYYNQAITLLEPLAQSIGDDFFIPLLLRAYVRSNNSTATDALLRKHELTAEASNWQRNYLEVGKEFLLANERDKAIPYFDKVIRSKTIKDSLNLANAYYYKENYQASEGIFRSLHSSDSTNVDVLTKLAVVMDKLGNTAEASQFIKTVELQKEPYSFGTIEYEMARYYAAIGDEDKAIALLIKSISEGNRYSRDGFQNDPHFRKFKNTAKFKQVLQFWQ